MTPVLPAFTGYVPRAITRVLPDATVVNGSSWGNVWPAEYSNVTFLQPTDENFAKMQKSFIEKQIEAYGDVSHIYTLDQYNENTPYSGDIDYLRDVSRQTVKSLKAADPKAIWMMQGWVFHFMQDFWTLDRIEAYLSGVEKNDDILILDLFSEAFPQWQRTKSYFGRPWIWCQLHDFGAINGFHGQVQNLTNDPIEALNSAESMVGVGLTMEGQEGNEIIYTLLLDQAWSKQPLDIEEYFRKWVTTRYAGNNSIPDGLNRAWQTIRKSAYSSTLHQAFFGQQIQLSTPRLDVDPVVYYDSKEMVQAWLHMTDAAREEPALWTNPAYKHDMLDITREVLENAFKPLYDHIVRTYKANNDPSSIRKTGTTLLALLSTLDKLLSTDKNFSLDAWIRAARAQAGGNDTVAAFFEYNARNQVTLWGPNGEISDYAAKSWGGLYGTYYLRRWRMWIEYLVETGPGEYDQVEFGKSLREFEEGWQWERWEEGDVAAAWEEGLEEVLRDVVAEWSELLRT